ncbi:MAG: leucine-rich repeat domain-containing protein [Ruminococcaceae bacterium]|nr:leucine-rich repeat domain-containing protein [Oscillospiraceae bacterium]
MKHIKRTLTLLLVIALLATTALLFASCSDKKESGIAYELSTDKSYYIVTGIGNYAGTALSIPKTYDGKPVLEIAKNAFKDCTDLTSVTLPDGLEVIRAGAFSGCTGLTSIKIPDTVVSMGSGVFKGCKDLEVTVPFAKAPSGWSDDWDTGIDEIIWESKEEDDETEKSTESDTSSKPTVAYSKGLEFAECYRVANDLSTKSYMVTGLGTCTDTIVSIPPTHQGLNVISIDDGAFRYCTSIKEVIIPDSVGWIAEGAFAGCSSLESITLPTVNYKLTNMISGDYYRPFGYIFGENEFPDSSKAKQYCGYKDYEEIYATYYIPTSLKNVTVTKALSDDCVGAFSNCSTLVSVTLPESATTLGYKMFDGCTSLETVNLPSGIKSVSNECFQNCSSLTSIALPEGTTTVGVSAFERCTKLENIELPSTLKTINNSAFSDCQALTSITLPAQLETIERDAFSGCTALESITLPSTLQSIRDYAFRGCTALQSIVIPQSVTYMGHGVFDDTCTALINIYVCAPSIPYDWEASWNSSDASVQTGYTG